MRNAQTHEDGAGQSHFRLNAGRAQRSLRRFQSGSHAQAHHRPRLSACEERKHQIHQPRQRRSPRQRQEGDKSLPLCHPGSDASGAFQSIPHASRITLR